MSSGWVYDDCTPLDRSVSEHSSFGILLLCSAVCLCACLCSVTLRAHLPVIVYALLVVVLSCKRKPAGHCTFAERLRTVAKRVTERRLQVDCRGRASLGRRHDTFIPHQGYLQLPRQHCSCTLAPLPALTTSTHPWCTPKPPGQYSKGRLLLAFFCAQESSVALYCKYTSTKGSNFT